MTDLAALRPLTDAARAISAATTGKVAREALPKPVRLALAGLEGALARLDGALRDEAGRAR